MRRANGGVRGEREDLSVWLATRLGRRSFLVRAGAAVTSVVGATFFRLPQSAVAASCGCCEGDACGFQINCYRRCVCACSAVAVRYCPGGTAFGTLQRTATFDIQSPPSGVSGYRWGYAFGDVNNRGWVLESCLTNPIFGSCNGVCI